MHSPSGPWSVAWYPVHISVKLELCPTYNGAVCSQTYSGIVRRIVEWLKCPCSASTQGSYHKDQVFCVTLIQPKIENKVLLPKQVIEVKLGFAQQGLQAIMNCVNLEPKIIIKNKVCVCVEDPHTQIQRTQVTIWKLEKSQTKRWGKIGRPGVERLHCHS